MFASTFDTCNLYPREVWSRFKPSFITFGPRTSSRTERFQSRDANPAHPSVATPLPWHHRSRKRPVFFHREPSQLCPGDIQLARLRRRASRRHSAGLLARRSASLEWSRNAPIASDARPTATRRTRERRRRRITMVKHGVYSDSDSMSRALGARARLAGAARE